MATLVTDPSPDYVSPALIALVAKHAPAELDLFHNLLSGNPPGSHTLLRGNSPAMTAVNKVVFKEDSKRGTKKGDHAHRLRVQLSEKRKESRTLLTASAAPRSGRKSPDFFGASSGGRPNGSAGTENALKSELQRSGNDKASRSELQRNGIAGTGNASRSELQRPSSSSKSEARKSELPRPRSSSPKKNVSTAPVRKYVPTVPSPGEFLLTKSRSMDALKKALWTVRKKDSFAVSQNKDPCTSYPKRDLRMPSPKKDISSPNVPASPTKNISKKDLPCGSPRSDLSRDTVSSSSFTRLRAQEPTKPSLWDNSEVEIEEQIVSSSPSNSPHVQNEISEQLRNFSEDKQNHQQPLRTLKTKRKRNNVPESKTTYSYKERVKEFDQKRRSKTRPSKSKVNEQKPPWDSEITGQCFEGVGPWFGSPTTKQLEMGLPLTVDMDGPKIMELELSAHLKGEELGGAINYFRSSIVDLTPAAATKQSRYRLTGFDAGKKSRPKEPVIRKASWKTGAELSQKPRRSLSALGLVARSKRQKAVERRMKDKSPNMTLKSPSWPPRRPDTASQRKRSVEAEPKTKDVRIEPQKNNVANAIAKKKTPNTKMKPTRDTNPDEKGQKRKQKDDAVQKRCSSHAVNTDPQDTKKLRPSSLRGSPKTYLPLIKDLAQQLVYRVDAACISNMLNEGVEICFEGNPSSRQNEGVQIHFEDNTDSVDFHLQNNTNSGISENEFKITELPPDNQQTSLQQPSEEIVYSTAILAKTKEKSDLTESEQAGTANLKEWQSSKSSQWEQVQYDQQPNDERMSELGSHEGMHEIYLPTSRMSLEAKVSKLSRSSPDIFQIKLPNVDRLKRDKQDDIHGRPSKMRREGWSLQSKGDPLSVINIYASYRLSKEQEESKFQSCDTRTPRQGGCIIEEIASLPLEPTIPQKPLMDTEKSNRRSSTDTNFTSSTSHVVHAPRKCYKKPPVSLWRRLSVEIKKLKRISKSWKKSHHSKVKCDGSSKSLGSNVKAQTLRQSYYRVETSVSSIGSSTESNEFVKITQKYPEAPSVKQKVKNNAVDLKKKGRKRTKRRTYRNLNYEAQKIEWLEKNVLRKRREVQHWRLKWKRHVLETELKRLDVEIYETRVRIERNTGFQAPETFCCKDVHYHNVVKQASVVQTKQILRDTRTKSVGDGSESAVDTTNYSDSFTSEPDEREPERRFEQAVVQKQEDHACTSEAMTRHARDFKPPVSLYKDLTLPEDIASEPNGVSSGEANHVQTVSEEDISGEDKIEGLGTIETGTVPLPRQMDDQVVDNQVVDNQVDLSDIEQTGRVLKQDEAASVNSSSSEETQVYSDIPDDLADKVDLESEPGTREVNLVKTETEEAFLPFIRQLDTDALSASHILPQSVSMFENPTFTEMSSPTKPGSNDQRTEEGELYSLPQRVETGAMDNNAPPWSLSSGSSTSSDEVAGDNTETSVQSGMVGESRSTQSSDSTEENSSETSRADTDTGFRDEEEGKSSHFHQSQVGIPDSNTFGHVQEGGESQDSKTEMASDANQTRKDVSAPQVELLAESGRAEHKEQPSINLEAREMDVLEEDESSYEDDTFELDLMAETRSPRAEGQENLNEPRNSGSQTFPLESEEQAPQETPATTARNDSKDLSISKRQMLEELLNIEEGDIPEEICIDDLDSGSADDNADLNSEGFEHDISRIRAAFDSIRNADEEQAKEMAASSQAEFVSLSKAYPETSKSDMRKTEARLDDQLDKTEKHQVCVANVLFANILQLDSGAAALKPRTSSLSAPVAKLSLSLDHASSRHRHKRQSKNSASLELEIALPSIHRDYVHEYVLKFLQLNLSSSIESSTPSLLESSMQQHPSFERYRRLNAALHDCVSEIFAKPRLESALLGDAELASVVAAKVMSVVDLWRAPRLLREDAAAVKEEEDLSVAIEVCEELLDHLLDELVLQDLL